jgi:xanthosine utilization system XapX-like protein
MIIALLALIAVAVVFIAMQTRREGTPAIRSGFLWALAAVVIVGIVLAVLHRRSPTEARR